MSFKSLLVFLRSYPESTPLGVLEDAVEVAALLRAHISALCIAALPGVPRSTFGNALLDVTALVETEHRKIEVEARRVLESLTQRATPRSVGTTQILRACEPGDVSAVLASYTRLHDLTVVSMPEGDYLSHFDSQWFAESAIFDSGRPTMILPQSRGGRRPIVFENVLVAWDGSRTAARVVADALPILKRASSVMIVTVTGEKAIPIDPAPEQLSEKLAAHRIRATHRLIPIEDWHIGDLLMHCARTHSADVIVMGAYGRSRLAEFVLGGATKSLLTHPPVPLLVSH